MVYFLPILITRPYNDDMRTIAKFMEKKFIFQFIPSDDQNVNMLTDGDHLFSIDPNLPNCRVVSLAVLWEGTVSFHICLINF